MSVQEMLIYFETQNHIKTCHCVLREARIERWHNKYVNSTLQTLVSVVSSAMFTLNIMVQIEGQEVLRSLVIREIDRK